MDIYVRTTFRFFDETFSFFGNFIFSGIFSIFIVRCDFHEQKIKEIIDFGVPGHQKSMKIHQMYDKISPRLLGVGTQT